MGVFSSIWQCILRIRMSARIRTSISSVCSHRNAYETHAHTPFICVWAIYEWAVGGRLNQYACLTRAEAARALKVFRRLV
uniref:Secreted protein n=1 Tax=Ascaris lumbricoides TaxID=6252 RepID=A0A0M3IUV4_ASCLU